MKTPTTVLEISESTPGTEIAAETSATMAASSIVFRHIDCPYAHRHLNKAKLVCIYILLNLYMPFSLNGCIFAV